MNTHSGCAHARTDPRGLLTLHRRDGHVSDISVAGALLYCLLFLSSASVLFRCTGLGSCPWIV
jgi:hypothetical protein